MDFTDITTGVKELGDGRTFTDAEYAGWANRIRKTVAMDFIIGGFWGLYFLYKEATVVGGSVVGQYEYAVPDDFIDDLNVFLEDVLLAKVPPGTLDVTLAGGDTPSSSMWVELRGQMFRITPAPTVAGDEIKLLYNALPAEILVTTVAADYFMKTFPDLHIFGMGYLMALRLGKPQVASEYKGLFEEEKKKLQLHNRRHFFKNAKIRFQNWDEYQNVRHIVFPQFQDS